MNRSCSGVSIARRERTSLTVSTAWSAVIADRPAFLLPPEFTLTELQRVYEITLGRTLEKKAFRTRILAAELLEEVPRQREGANRPAQLFRLAHRGRLVYFPRALVGAPKD